MELFNVWIGGDIWYRILAEVECFSFCLTILVTISGPFWPLFSNFLELDYFENAEGLISLFIFQNHMSINGESDLFACAFAATLIHKDNFISNDSLNRCILKINLKTVLFLPVKAVAASN